MTTNELQNIETGTVIDAGKLSDSSFYSKVRAKITGFRNGFYQIEAFEVISKWSNEWEKHPSSCSMNVKENQILKLINA